MTTATAPTTFAQDEVCSLAMLKKGECATVTGFAMPEDAEQSAMQNRLLELGFSPGEPIRIVAESFPNRDPIAVRLGNTTFALRRHEAVRVHVVRGLRAVI